MVKHVVCFKLLDNSPKMMAEAQSVLLSMKGKVPMLKNVEAHCDFLKSHRSYDIILLTDFESKEDLELYQKDEYHCSVVKKYMHAHVATSIAIDYEY